MTEPNVPNISERCSLVTFLVMRPIKIRTGLTGTCGIFSSLATRAFLFGLGDFDLDLRDTSLVADVSAAFSFLELLESRLEERLEDRDFLEDELEPDRELPELELPELELKTIN